MPSKPAVHYNMLLRIRKRQEDLRARALAAAQRDVQAAARQLADIEQQQRAALFEAGTRARDAFDAREVRLYYQYERHLARRADELQARLDQLRQAAEQRRAELEEAMKRRRIIEKLIDRKQRAYDAALRKEERGVADETAGNYALRARAAHASRSLDDTPEPGLC